MFDIFWYDNPNNIQDLIKEKQTVSKTEYFWLANSDVDYRNFNWRWLPKYHQKQYCHAWASHANPQFYTTFLVPTFDYIGTVHHNSVLPTNNNKYYDVCCINTNTHEMPQCDYSVALITTMQSAIDQAVKKTTKAWLWIVSDTCEYDGFNFGWLPNNHELNYIHCWPSGNCEKGDTFLINVNAYKNDNREYNFNHEPVKRKQWLSWFKHSNQNTLASYKDLTLKPIYTLFGFQTNKYPDVCLWDKRPIVGLNKSNSTSLIPRDYIFDGKELYNYPYLLRYPDVAEDIKSDIVFISYDEPEADKNYNELLKRFPHAKRSHGVSGMENALKAAAQLSESPWFYAVFAKTKIHEDFNFDYAPDFWQKPKHYIFYAKNTVNDLTYGHMGIVLYHSDTVINAPPFGKFGTDYTLSFEHQVVPIVSCYGSFNSNVYHTWRTAFREVHKLCEYADSSNCVETQYRIHTWLNNAHGDYSEWCLNGARDGKEFYDNHKDDVEYRRNTFRWEWLQEYFNSLHGKINE